MNAILLQREWHWPNGARAAMERVLEAEGDNGVQDYDLPLVDRLLTALWIEGYKLVPNRVNGS